MLSTGLFANGFWPTGPLHYWICGLSHAAITVANDAPIVLRGVNHGVPLRCAPAIVFLADLWGGGDSAMDCARVLDCGVHGNDARDARPIWANLGGGAGSVSVDGFGVFSE